MAVLRSGSGGCSPWCPAWQSAGRGARPTPCCFFAAEQAVEQPQQNGAPSALPPGLGAAASPPCAAPM
eukprot:CAMPEP_0168363294 /NCGR_PEP_ID=MMETSP0228-20121227/3616_1 /TAXON_ID=133427 /ORGANISM="Protoceratium reticulatum, Strain CCCM 535 (=CCMP 1889)" /LENGTH=67 /DNA_ID=CAMNT_0008376015 /DNA_START=963 /DNA_END=1163 /DNA_ORIENTATION=+